MTRDQRCESVLILLDDRWGAMRDQCDLPKDHPGEHSIEYTATMPLAHMRWSDDSGT